MGRTFIFNPRSICTRNHALRSFSVWRFPPAGRRQASLRAKLGVAPFSAGQSGAPFTPEQVYEPPSVVSLFAQALASGMLRSVYGLGRVAFFRTGRVAGRSWAMPCVTRTVLGSRSWGGVLGLQSRALLRR
ncbi:unnamed protein product [Peniophora sp. CBMAI 1063]|nr:unnamed protein product [Peniophora sp. CBMAI 1063]